MNNIELTHHSHEGNNTENPGILPVSYPERFEGPRHRASILSLAETAHLLAHKDQLISEGLVDQVTGLKNNSALVKDLSEMLKDAGAGDLSVMFVDVDGLKRVNDAEEGGHELGDNYLKLVADTLAGSNNQESALRSYDRAYRKGGDEFIVLLPRVHDEASDRHSRPADQTDLSALKKRLSTSVDRAIETDQTLSNIHSLGVSIGYATLSAEDLEAGDVEETMRRVIDRADQAMKDDKDERYNKNPHGRALREADTRLKK